MQKQKGRVLSLDDLYDRLLPEADCNRTGELQLRSSKTMRQSTSGQPEMTGAGRMNT